MKKQARVLLVESPKLHPRVTVLLQVATGYQQLGLHFLKFPDIYQSFSKGKPGVFPIQIICRYDLNHEVK